jgi:hypothetical protein
MNNNDLKRLAIGMSVDDELYDSCTGCQTFTHIADIHLFTGLCNICTKPKKKYSEKQLRELLELDKGFKDE